MFKHSLHNLKTPSTLVRCGYVLLMGFAAPTMISGCGGSSTSSPVVTTPNPPAPSVNPAVTAKNIYSIDLANQSLDVYTANLNGTVSPNFSYPVGALAVAGDASGNIYAATYSATQAGISVFAPGMITPTRTIVVATAASNPPQINSLAVDSASNLYVAINSTIEVFGPTATGAATPVRTLAGSSTLLTANMPQMAFDAKDNLYVVTGGVSTGSGYQGSQVIEFPATVTGNVPSTIITAPTIVATGVALDSAGNIYVSQGGAPNPSYNPLAGNYRPAIYVFPKGSVAGATPARTITGSNLPVSLYTDGVFVDSAGNIFMSVVNSGQTDFLVFSATANGNVAPASTIVRTKGDTGDSKFFLM
jgi:hypothetical protein